MYSSELFLTFVCIYTYLIDPEVTRNGIGVGHGLNGELLSELLVLLITECGH